MSQIDVSLANDILDLILREESYTPPTNIYVALYDGDPLGEGEDLGTEVDVGNYVRQSVSFNEASDKETDNSLDVQFPEADTDWGDVTHIALYDADSDGNILFAGALENSRTVYEGDTLRFNENEIVITID